MFLLDLVNGNFKFFLRKSIHLHNFPLSILLYLNFNTTIRDHSRNIIYNLIYFFCCLYVDRNDLLVLKRRIILKSDGFMMFARMNASPFSPVNKFTLQTKPKDNCGFTVFCVYSVYLSRSVCVTKQSRSAHN